MAEKEIKLNLNVDSSKGEASIKRTSTQLKGLGTAAAASGTAIGAGSKTAAGGILMMSAATIKAAGGTTKLGKETHKLIKNMTSSKVAALKEAKAFVKKDVTMLKLMKTMKATTAAIVKQKQKVLASVSAMRKFRKEVDGGAGGGTGGIVGALKKYKTGIMAAVAATTYIGYGMAKASAAAEQQSVAFGNLAASHGVNADKIINDLRRMSAETVDTATIIQKAGTAMMMGIDPTKLSDLMQIARATSKMTGQSVVEAFDNISMAVGRQSKMILDNLGIIVSIEKANKNYAKQMGITGRELTDMEKKQAFLNETLTKGKDLVNRIGEDGVSNIEKFQRFEAAVSDLKVEFGSLLLAITPVIEALTKVINFMASYEQAAIDLEATGWMAKPNFMEKPKADAYVDITTPKGGAAAGGEETTIGPASEEGKKRAEAWFAEWERMEAENQRNRILIRHEGYEQQKRLLELERDKMVEIYGDQTAIHTHFNIRRALLDQAMLDEKMKNEEEAAERRAADHAEVLQYISTEEENSLRAINTERDAMLERTTTLEEYIAVMERSAELKGELAEKTETQKNAISEWASTAITLTEQWEATAIHAAESFSSGITDAFFEFAEGTKSAEDAFRDFAASFLKQIAKMIMQQLILNALKSVAGSYFGDGGVVEGGEQTALAKGGVLSQGKMMEYAKGAVFNNGMKMHAFATGGVVSQPTVFPMANGMGLMGEAGPEAIMPLKRGKNGKLGVEGGGGNTINTTINITTGGQGEDPEESKRRGREMARVVEAEFNRNLTKQMRPGGLLNQQ